MNFKSRFFPAEGKSGFFHIANCVKIDRVCKALKRCTRGGKDVYRQNIKNRRTSKYASEENRTVRGPVCLTPG